MVWWFAAPLVIWGAKKIYEAATEDDEPSYSSSSTLSSAKASRTRLRKNLIREAILKNRKHLISEFFNEKESNFVNLDGSSSASAILDSSGFNATLDSLSDTIILLNPSYCYSSKKNDESLLIFSDIKDDVNNVAKKADHEYGTMAGIDHYNSYDKLADPFVAKLEVELSR